MELLKAENALLRGKCDSFEHQFEQPDIDHRLDNLVMEGIPDSYADVASLIIKQHLT